MIWSAANRITSSGKVFGENQCVPVLEAIKSVTTHAAFQAFAENHKGSLEVGKLADLVVLDANPLKVDPIKIKDIGILATIVDGTVVYRKILRTWETIFSIVSLGILYSAAMFPTPNQEGKSYMPAQM